MDPLRYVLSWEKNNNNGTQGNNKITTATKKDREQESEHAVSAGKRQVWAKGYDKVHKVNNEADHKALLDCQTITNFLFLFLVLFSSFFFQLLPQMIPFASYGKLGCCLPLHIALLRDEEVMVCFFPSALISEDRSW